MKGEWVRLPNTSPSRLILYFHGGGYIAGSPETHRALVARLAQAARGERLFAGLSPGAGIRVSRRRCATAIDAYRQLIRPEELRPQSIVLAGDGSGGGLAFAVLLAIRNAGLADAGGLRGDVALGRSVLVGLVRDAERQERHRASLGSALRQRAALSETAPIRAIPTRRRPSPASRIFRPSWCMREAMEMLRDDASRLGDRAADAGVPVSVEIYDGMQHVFQASSAPEAR